MSENLTRLEEEVIRLTCQENWPQFRTDRLRVIRRENTGAGRYTHIEDGHHQRLADGTYSADGRMIEMVGVDSGLGFAVDVSNSRLSFIELFTFGNEDWDGVERKWNML